MRHAMLAANEERKKAFYNHEINSLLSKKIAFLAVILQSSSVFKNFFVNVKLEIL